MEVTASVLAEIDPELEASESICATGRKPVQAHTVAEVLAHAEQMAQSERLVAVIAPAELLDETRTGVREFLGGGDGGTAASTTVGAGDTGGTGDADGVSTTDTVPATRPDRLTNCVVYDITTSEGPGLDEIIVVAPDQIIA